MGKDAFRPDRYRTGDGVAKDDAEAARFFRLAADQGYSDAERRLGILYECGHGVPRDPAEAIRWYERAAAKDDTLARASAARLLAPRDHAADSP